MVVHQRPAGMEGAAAQDSLLHLDPQAVAHAAGELGVLPGVGGLILPQDGAVRHTGLHQHGTQVGPLGFVVVGVVLPEGFRHAFEMPQQRGVAAGGQHVVRHALVIQLRRPQCVFRVAGAGDEDHVALLGRVLHKNELRYCADKGLRAQGQLTVHSISTGRCTPGGQPRRGG